MVPNRRDHRDRGRKSPSWRASASCGDESDDVNVARGVSLTARGACEIERAGSWFVRSVVGRRRRSGRTCRSNGAERRVLASLRPCALASLHLSGRTHALLPRAVAVSAVRACAVGARSPPLAPLVSSGLSTPLNLVGGGRALPAHARHTGAAARLARGRLRAEVGAIVRSIEGGGVRHRGAVWSLRSDRSMERKHHLLSPFTSSGILRISSLVATKRHHHHCQSLFRGAPLFTTERDCRLLLCGAPTLFAAERNRHFWFHRAPPP